ncbi:hypothetical protein N1F89_20285 [Aquibium sp. A9E412]|uniref:hypothetical protein n=1 Tax=Aquibium sp. A9E412 TaxID=2976767 RepID=UPI0025B11F72|nr:hypothetical protein [Aquibium sp. A9E412]MDN2568569.1 hypothetical protein [Aquibium sp. A9E412]
MLQNRLFGLLAYALFATFLGIIAFKVMIPDLFVACLVGLLLAGFDLWTQLFPRGRR